VNKKKKVSRAKIAIQLILPALSKIYLYMMLLL
jgi:hypothetical protein